MSTQTYQSSGVGSVPRVDLMPPEIAESARLRQVQAVMGVAVVAAIAIVGLLYMHEHSKVADAKVGLKAAQDGQAGLNSKLASLASVQQTYAEVQAKQALLTSALGGEVRWSYVLNDLSLRIPHDVVLTSIAATETVFSSPATAATNPAAPTIGTVTFVGIALRHDDLAGWLDVLAKEKGFSSPTFSSDSQTPNNNIAFTNAVNVTSSAESGRYATPPAIPAGTVG